MALDQNKAMLYLCIEQHVTDIVSDIFKSPDFAESDWKASIEILLIMPFCKMPKVISTRSPMTKN